MEGREQGRCAGKYGHALEGHTEVAVAGTPLILNEDAIAKELPAADARVIGSRENGARRVQKSREAPSHLLETPRGVSVGPDAEHGEGGKRGRQRREGDGRGTECENDCRVVRGGKKRLNDAGQVGMVERAIHDDDAKVLPHVKRSGEAA